MSGDHPQMQDLEGHVEAVASGLEYFRRKRIEPRILLYLRWGGAIGWADSFLGREMAVRCRTSPAGRRTLAGGRHVRSG